MTYSDARHKKTATEKEQKFLFGIKSKSALIGYLKSCKTRNDWDGIDMAIVVPYAEKLLSQLGGKHHVIRK